MIEVLRGGAFLDAESLNLDARTLKSHSVKPTPLFSESQIPTQVLNVIEDVVLRGAAILDVEPYIPRLLPRLADILTLPSLQGSAPPPRYFR